MMTVVVSYNINILMCLISKYYKQINIKSKLNKSSMKQIHILLAEAFILEIIDVKINEKH